MLLEDRIHEFVGELFPLDRAATAGVQQRDFPSKGYDKVIAAAAEDLLAYVGRDPALMGEPRFALVQHSPYVATLCYRLAYWHWHQSSIEMRRQAMSIGHYSRALTGVEIHPGARLGPRFVVDHGTNTVIGATCEIGSDCYVLNGVLLGARGISGNPDIKRHPTIGDRVQIGSFARILGNVHVGDDAFIGPHAVVTCDTPAGARVRAVHPAESAISGFVEETRHAG
ncbi:Serine acetyltransferase [Paracoccus halophilus]|uniref:Serine acetyltransferase n=1 Tax=Paracoccus halophilus TaxID=376733 RepID=A0A1I0SW83_9RHOB|nr:serine O-acetyltransferase [Paracoccus halophilus]SFA43764.1 Serine acetyltransferase [Paracoccus halophilus]